MDQLPVAGLNSILSKEHGNKFYNLPIIRHLEKDVGAVAAWDSSVHDSEYLNRVTESKSHYIPDCENKYCFDIVMSVLVYVFGLHQNTKYNQKLTDFISYNHL